MVVKARLLLLGLAALPLLGCQPRAGVNINFLLGYSHVDQDESGGVEPVIDGKGGGRLAFGADAPIGDNPGQSGLRLGGRLAFSVYRQNLGDRNVAGEPQLEIEDYLELLMISPQFVASYRQVVGDPRRGAAFIEPGVGLGFGIGVLTAGSDLTFGDAVIGTDYGDSETEVGPTINPYLRGGAYLGRALVGIEAGYQWSWLEFDGLGKDPSEWYVGLFVAFRGTD